MHIFLLRAVVLAALGSTAGCGAVQFGTHSRFGDAGRGRPGRGGMNVGIENQRRALFNALHASEDALPADGLESYATAANDLGDSPEGAFHRYYATGLKVINAWRVSLESGPMAISTVLGGHTSSTGVVKAKHQDITVQAKAGNCYTVITHFATPSDATKVEIGSFSTTPSHSIQRFRAATKFEAFDKGDLHLGSLHGFCASVGAPVTATITVTFPGTRNALHYVVVTHERANFPLFLATYAVPYRVDQCNAEEWASLWRDPIPGSIGYISGEPVLGSAFDGPGRGTWMSYRNMSAAEGRAQYPRVVQEPPAKANLRAKIVLPTCTENPTRTTTPDTKRLAECWKRLDRMFAPRYEAAEAAKRDAPTIGALRAAEGRLAAIRREAAAAMAAQCAPIHERVSKAWERTVNTVVDSYADKAYASPVQRFHDLATIGEAQVQVR